MDLLTCQDSDIAFCTQTVSANAKVATPCTTVRLLPFRSGSNFEMESYDEQPEKNKRLCGRTKLDESPERFNYESRDGARGLPHASETPPVCLQAFTAGHINDVLYRRVR